MNLKRIILFVTCLVTLANIANAQTITNTLRGKIEKGGLKEGTFLVFRTFGYDDILENWLASNTYNVPVDSLGEFKLNFVAPDSCFYMEMEILTKESKIMELFQSLSDIRYLCERGDSVDLRINLDKKMAYFNGRGADKLNCQFYLNAQQLPLPAGCVVYSPQLTHEPAILRKSRFESNILDLKKNMLKAYEPLLSKKIYQRIEADMLIRSKFNYIKTLPYGPVAEKLKAETRGFYLSNINNKASLIYVDEKLTESPEYSNFILKRAKIFYDIFEKAKPNPISRTDWTLNFITENFSDTVRENLLIAFYITDIRVTPKELANILPAITKLISTKKNRQLFSKVVEKLDSKGKAFPFSLKDENGNSVTLDQFKDKIILMDFWFTGCHGCTQIPPVLKIIMDDLKDRDDIVYMSVSIDMRKGEWFRGLATGKYTTSGQLHLYTGGLGWDDPFVAEYNIRMFPQLCLIGKKGRIITMNPPDPRKDKGQGIIKLIRNEAR